MTRRFTLTFVALASIASLLLAACGTQVPARPEITDPKQILTETIVSLKDVKTVEFTGALTGTLQVAELGGDLDLSKVKMSGAFDIPGKKGKFNLDAPEVLGTKIEAILIDNAAYYKVIGLLGTMLLGGSTAKFTKTELPASSSGPVTDPAEIAKGIEAMKLALNQLPTPPTKVADEKCGDQDCYHVTLGLTADQLKALSPTTGSPGGDVAFDLWSRKSDLRPAKISMSVVSPDVGTVGVVIEIKYDVSVSVEAPPADQIEP